MNMRAIDDESDVAGDEMPPPIADQAPAHWDDASPPAWHRTACYALIVVAIAWPLGLIWLARDSLFALPAIDLARFVGTLALGPILAGIAWLLLLRTSTAEAQRFGATARAMRDEATALEAHVGRLNDALSQSHRALAEQARTLVTIGDAASDRLTAIGRGLSEEIDQADVHARALTQAVDGAQSHLSVLLASMPRATQELTVLGDRIDSLALSAGEHASALDAQVVALADRGHHAETVAGGAAQKLAAHIARMDATSESAGQRLELVTNTMSTAVDALLDRTAQAIDTSRKGIASQGEAMLAMVSANQAALDSAVGGSIDRLAERIEVIDSVIERLAQRLDAQRSLGEELTHGLEAGIARVAGQLETMQRDGTARNETLAHAIGALGSSADAMNEALRTGDALGTQTISTAETLLIALDAAAREIDETLPDALDRLDARIVASKTVVTAAKPELLSLVTAAESTHDAIEAIAQVIGDQRRIVEVLNTTLIEALSTGRVKADAMGQMVEEAVERANRFADQAAPQLIEALMRVRDTATAAADHARDTLSRVIPEAADALEHAGAQAFGRAIEATLPARIAEIGEIAKAAVAASEQAAERLERQITTIDASTGAIDARIQAARAERESAEADSFARRASLLIEAMNSAAIDITTQFAADVADTSWAAYLKGDRGVFTRRAVRLIDATTQRDVASMYDDDAAFRDQVNRYIHDFEAMLRTILAQRDGSPLGVTLLSSDMGKLYVALAQAIERLR